jgi:hypothetical protein
MDQSFPAISHEKVVARLPDRLFVSHRRISLKRQRRARVQRDDTGLPELRCADRQRARFQISVRPEQPRRLGKPKPGRVAGEGCYLNCAWIDVNAIGDEAGEDPAVIECRANNAGLAIPELAHCVKEVRNHRRTRIKVVADYLGGDAAMSDTHDYAGIDER